MQIMDNKSFSTTFLVDQNPKQVFDAINNVQGWWSEGVEGGTHHLNDEFVYRHRNIHYSKQKLVDVIPDQKVVWLVTDASLSFTKKKDEWKGTKVSFDISKSGNKTQLRFTHEGLTPAFECFSECSKGWGYYLNDSLLPLITTGKGQPDKM